MGKEKFPLESTTRTFETTRGVVSYAELSEMIAPNLLELQKDIEEGKYSGNLYNEKMILEFHKRIVGNILPKIAGRWRRVPVMVGNWLPPEPFEVPVRIREYVKNMQERIKNASDIDLQIETLTYAEGEFLSIHPFQDFNGRTVRALLDFLLNEFSLPLIDTSAKRGTTEFKEYQNVLAEYDNGKLGPLVKFWEQRFKKTH